MMWVRGRDTCGKGVAPPVAAEGADSFACTVGISVAKKLEEVPVCAVQYAQMDVIDQAYISSLFEL